MKIFQRSLLINGNPAKRLGWLSLITSLLFVAHSAAAELPYCSDIYSNGAQTFGNRSYIHFAHNARITNASSVVLNTVSVADHRWSIRKSCDLASCSASGSAVRKPQDMRKFTTQSATEVAVPAHKKITVGAGETNQFGYVRLSEWSTGVFSSQHKVYIIDRLEIGYKASLRLPAGEYWVRSLIMDVESRIDVVGDGVVNLYVTHPLQIPMNAKVNSNTQNPARFTLYTYDSAEFHPGSQTYGFARINGEAYLHHRAKLSGGVIANMIDLSTESQIIYDATAARLLTFTNICRASEEPTPADTTPPEIFDILSGTITTNKMVFAAVIRDTGVNHSGVASVVVQTSTGEFPMLANGDTYTVELTFRGGDNALNVIARDHAGNETQFLTNITLDSPPRFENVSYPEFTPTQPIVMTGEVHTYWPAEELIVNIANKPVTLLPVTDGVYRFETVIVLDGFYNRFSMGVSNPIGEGVEALFSVFYHPPAFYVTVDQHNQTTSEDTITLTGTFGIPGEEFNTEIIGLIAVGDTIEGEVPVTIEEINTESGRFSVDVPLLPGENYFAIRVLNTVDQFPWESGATITRTSP